MAERIYKYDNIKALLIYLVVLGHMLRPFVTSDSGSSLVYILIYLFHMPAFLYLMGMFAKPSVKRMQLFFLLYLVFQPIYFLFLRYVVSDDMYSTFSLGDPVWITWYLWAVVVYSLLVYFIPKELSKAMKLLAVIGACIVALLVGYVPFIGTELAWSRITVFLPFFLAGYYRLFSEKLRPVFAVLLCVVSFGLVIFYILFNSTNINTLHHKWPYVLSFADWTDRAMMIVIAFCFIKLLVLVVPNKLIPVLSDIGRHTLFIYLIHGFVVKLILRFYTPVYPLLFGVICSIFIVVLLWLCDKGYQLIKQKILSRLRLSKENG